MIRDLVDDEYGREGLFDSTLLHKEMNVLMDDGVSERYAESCVEFFNNMPKDVVERLRLYTWRYCESHRLVYQQEYDEPLEIPVGVQPDEIFDYISPNSMVIERPKRREIPAFHVELECEWEPADGMEWAFKDGKILYVGPFIGLEPWNKNQLNGIGFFNTQDLSLNCADKASQSC